MFSTVATRELFGLDALSVPPSLEEAVEHGEVFTRRWVVDLILDLVGYTADRDLAKMVIVEPACGGGAFLGSIVERLSKSCRDRGRALTSALDSVRAFDLLDRNVRRSRESVEQGLVDQGWSRENAQEASRVWVNQGDYLLHDHSSREVDFVVGNPPYIRLEDVPDDRMNLYRRACTTMGGRADIYVGFFEKALKSLQSNGRLGFICADRWMRNQYGSRLRELIGQNYCMELTLSMHDADAFDEQVSAYPAITVIRNAAQGRPVAAEATGNFGSSGAAELLSWMHNEESDVLNASTIRAARLDHWFTGGDTWPADFLRILRSGSAHLRAERPEPRWESESPQAPTRYSSASRKMPSR
jgi:adenine-specific DNA-methyltransferase